MYSVSRGLDGTRTNGLPGQARLRAGALALGTCIAILALVHVVSVTGGALRWSFLTQALVFLGLSTLALNSARLRDHSAARAIGLHLLICLSCTYGALCLLARTVVVPVHDVLTLTLAAFAEEVTFRLALPGYLSKQLAFMAHGAIVSAVLAQFTFAAAHMANVESPLVAALELAVLTANGLFLLVIARRAGLGPAGASHAVFNAAGSVELPHVPAQGPIQWALVAIAGVLLGTPGAKRKR